MVKKIIVVFSCLIFICSCKKETPADYPSVQISSPYSLATFNVPGSIQVTGHVSDGNTLTSVTVYIANGQNIPVEQVLQIPITSNNMNISCTYYLNDIHLASGEYYMTISASNGSNTSSAFQQIYIDAVPTKRTAIYAITRNSAGVHAWGIDSVFQIAPAYSYTVPGDYSSSDINSYYQQLYIAGHDSGNVNVYSAPNPSFAWSLTGVPSPAPYFTNVYCNNDAEYVSYYNNVHGYINCYNHFGQIQGVYNTAVGYYPIKTFVYGGWLFTEEESITSSQENLVTYYASSGAGFQQTAIGGPVTAMYVLDNDHVFIFGNYSSGGAYIQLYSISGNTFYTPALPIGTYGNILSAAQVTANTYLVGFSNGNVYQYTYNPIGILSYIPGLKASSIRYDSINNQIITASGKTVSAYNYSIGFATLANSVTISDSVRDLRVLYNK